MSGGFVWSDEGLREVAEFCSADGNYAHRAVIAYRASLIRGEPRNELADAWRQLSSACPKWPGFRPERRDTSLKAALDAENADMLAQLDHLSEVVERAQRIAAIREKRSGKWWRLWPRHR